MKFYKLKHSTQPKVIGRRYPQSGIANFIEYNTDSSNSLYKVNPWEKITIDLNVPDYNLHGHSKRTDLLSTGGHHSHIMIFSKRLKELIEKFKLPETQVLETSVLARGKKYCYFLFYLPNNFHQFIDFSHSTFALVRMNARAVPTFTPQINSLKEFEEWISEYPYLIKNNPRRLKVIVDKLIFNSDKIPYDMFRIIGPISGYFVSERLKNAIEEKGYTGMDFIPLEKIETVLPPA